MAQSSTEQDVVATSESKGNVAIDPASLIVTPAKEQPSWLQFFDNRVDVDPSSKKKLFNTNNYYDRAPFIFSKENSQDSKPISRNDIQNEINAIKKKLIEHKPKAIIVCNECGQQFSSDQPYSDREAHKGMGKCHPIWNMNPKVEKKDNTNGDNGDYKNEEKLEEIVIDKENNPEIFVHFSKNILDQVYGLSKFFVKMKELKEIILIESKLKNIDNGVCFSLPLFSVLPGLFYLYMAEVTSYNLEIWYNQLQLNNLNDIIDNDNNNKKNDSKNSSSEIWYTAPAYMFKLNNDEINVISKECMNFKFQQKSSSLTKENQRTLTSLERKLERNLKRFGEYLDSIANVNDSKDDKDSQEIKENEENSDKISFGDVFETGEFFARLSTRSPKDSIKITDEILAKYPNRIDRIKMIVDKLKCRTASDILNLFYQSQRIFGDLMNFNKFAKYNAFAHDTMNIVIRPYFKNLEPKMEFRLFIKNNKINAISQYLCYDQFEILQDITFLTKVRKKILNFYNDDNVCKKLGNVYKNYVLDVFVSVDLKSIFIIEINPFGAYSSSGSALYEWISDDNILNQYDDKNSPYMRVAKCFDKK